MPGFSNQRSVFVIPVGTLPPYDPSPGQVRQNASCCPDYYKVSVRRSNAPDESDQGHNSTQDTDREYRQAPLCHTILRNLWLPQRSPIDSDIGQSVDRIMSFRTEPH